MCVLGQADEMLVQTVARSLQKVRGRGLAQDPNSRIVSDHLHRSERIVTLVVILRLRFHYTRF